jgi:hypothetical protein
MQKRSKSVDSFPIEHQLMTNVSIHASAIWRSGVCTFPCDMQIESRHILTQRLYISFLILNQFFDLETSTHTGRGRPRIDACADLIIIRGPFIYITHPYVDQIWNSTSDNSLQLVFPEMERQIDLDGKLTVFFGAGPQTPWVRFADYGDPVLVRLAGWSCFPQQGTNFSERNVIYGGISVSEQSQHSSWFM